MISISLVLALALAADYALPDDRMTTFRPGVTYNGGIPKTRDEDPVNGTRTQCALQGAGTGGAFTTTQRAAIQNAINNCPDNTYIKLGPGTFSSAAPYFEVQRSNITIRGSGPGVTIVQITGAGSPILVGNWDMAPQGFGSARNLTVDAVKGTNYALVASVTGLTVGEMVAMTERYDSTLTYYNGMSGQTNDYLGYGECRYSNSDAGNEYQCATLANGRAQSRPVGQMMEIESIGTAACTGVANALCLTFTTPFHQNLRVSLIAHLVRLTLNDHTTLINKVRRVGIENLTSRNVNQGDFSGNFVLNGVAYCWIRNVEGGPQIAGPSFLIAGGLRNEVRDSYFHSAQDPSPGGAGYIMEVEQYAADNLVENNIAWSGNKVISMRSTGGGNVIAYNYFEDGYGQGYPDIVEVGLNASHMAGSHMELFEGNQAFNFDSDSYWGTQHNIIVFRNHFTTLRRNMPGNLANLTDANNRRGIGLTVFQKNYSFVGNVIGYPNGYLQNPAAGSAYPATFSAAPQGTTLRYEWAGGPFGTDTGYTPMWQLGYNGTGEGVEGWPGWSQTVEPTSVASTLRDGNYDYASNLVHWHGINACTANAVTGVGCTTPPVNSTLPASLYLSSKPAFFGVATWPWVDATGSTKVTVLPARARFDAGYPNDTTIVTETSGGTTPTLSVASVTGHSIPTFTLVGSTVRLDSLPPGDAIYWCSTGAAACSPSHTTAARYTAPLTITPGNMVCARTWKGSKRYPTACARYTVQ